MGYSLSWIATKGLGKNDLYTRLQLSPTSESAKRRESRAQSRDQPDGWRLVVLGCAEHPLLKDAQLAALSKGCMALACNVEEHVMFSSAEQWSDGRRLWRLRHQGDVGVYDLEAQGDLPDSFPRIDEDCRNRQATDSEQPSVDFIFEIPLLIARSVATFKHDESDWDGFEALQWQGSRPWWRVW